ncbi:hypothetical protein BB559_001193 [Furculomyces boomerangus]|uniref:Uncharacterized protein n=1 Tax=Furculomyces boomerangus TaxID=61424 RepID=A0A2T9Z2Q8_9FUNG|nr:hypothetical protein BB559_001193 [Furculomyces boomerangus]
MESSLNKRNKLPTTHITAVKETNDMDIEDENQSNIKTSFKDNETNITPRTCSKNFWNVQGLSMVKWKTIDKLIREKHFDIIFLVETWFSNQEIYMDHPWFTENQRKYTTKK